MPQAIEQPETAAPVTVSRARLYIAMVLVALAIRLAVIPFVYEEHLDPFAIAHREYGRVAQSLALGQGFSNSMADTGPSALMPPVYPLILAGIFKVFGIQTKASILVALGFSSLCSALTAIPVFSIARRCFGSRVALWAGWGWVFSPYGIYYGAESLWSTCLIGLLLSLLFLATLKLADPTSTPRRILPWLGYGLLWGLAALTEPMVLSVLPFLVGWTCYRLHRHGYPWRYQSAVVVLALIAFCSPWFIRNYRVFHQVIPFRDGFGLELYSGNSGDSSYWVTKYLHPAHSDAEAQEYLRVGELRYMAHKKQQAFDFIGKHPGWFAWMSLRRALYTWTGYWSFDRAYLEQEPLDPPNVFLRTALTILTLLGLRRAFRNRAPEVFPFVAVLLFFPAVYFFTHANPSFIYPLDPLIVVLVCYFVAGRKLPYLRELSHTERRELLHKQAEI
jgi:4-amino-4-deoxy-L-arabinose transferase-like glycosyltransferase